MINHWDFFIWKDKHIYEHIDLIGFSWWWKRYLFDHTDNKSVNFDVWWEKRISDLVYSPIGKKPSRILKNFFGIKYVNI